MFPQQQDFAIRTFGMPGGAGFLGVCFGTVITANSPASQGASPSCWEATLWHEFCHVVTLNKTKNKMPRWLSEGISVYEERQADKTWGQTITPKYRTMMLGDDLVPVSQLSSAFLSPKTPLHLQFAYFESSLVVEFLVEKYGMPTLQRVLVDLGVGMPINESLGRYTGSIEALDKEFAAYARKHAEAMAPRGRLDRAGAAAAGDRRADRGLGQGPSRTTMPPCCDWPSSKSKSKSGRTRCKPRKSCSSSIPTTKAPPGRTASWPAIYREQGKNQEERAVLERLAELSDDDGEMFARLVEITQKAGDYQATKNYAVRWLAVNPLVPAPHRAAAAAAEGLGDAALAADCYRALLLLDPIDPAELHLKLATALSKSGRPAGGQAARPAGPGRDAPLSPGPQVATRNRRQECPLKLRL